MVHVDRERMMTMHTTTTVTEVNRRKLEMIETSMQAILAETLRHGFFGTVNLRMDIQNGTIHHVRSTMERIER